MYLLRLKLYMIDANSISNSQSLRQTHFKCEILRCTKKQTCYLQDALSVCYTVLSTAVSAPLQLMLSVLPMIALHYNAQALCIMLSASSKSWFNSKPQPHCRLLNHLCGQASPAFLSMWGLSEEIMFSARPLPWQPIIMQRISSHVKNAVQCYLISNIVKMLVYC